MSNDGMVSVYFAKNVWGSNRIGDSPVFPRLAVVKLQLHFLVSSQTGGEEPYQGRSRSEPCLGTGSVRVVLTLSVALGFSFTKRAMEARVF